jgi:type II secretion system protein I
MKSKIHSSRGFTLVEVMTALVIFSVVIVAFIQGIGATVSVQADLIWEQRAAMLAENILEEIRYTNDLAEGDNEGDFQGDAEYHWSSTIEPTDTDGLMQITVTITWFDGRRNGSYAVSTLMMSQPEVAL